MRLSNYSYGWTLKSSVPYEEIDEFKIFENILNLSDEDECYFHLSNELALLLHSEKQFNKVFEQEYGRIKYSDFLKEDKLKRLGTLQDAKPWFDSDELTVIDSTEDDFEVFKNDKLLFFLVELKKYLIGFKWHTEKPQLYSKLDEINLLIIIGQFCQRNGLRIKMISA
jgi:hypothetical protein